MTTSIRLVATVSILGGGARKAGQGHSARPDAGGGTNRALGLVGIAATLALAGGAFAAVPPVPVPQGNPITENKRILGKILFWDEQLSTSNVVSCGTCHSPSAGGADSRLANPPVPNHPGADGVFGTPDDVRGSGGIIKSDTEDDYIRDAVFAVNPQVTGRSANIVVNAAYAPLAFWDGRASNQFVDPQTGEIALLNGGALESQIVGPPVNSVEMAHAGMDWDSLVQKIARVRPLALGTNHPTDVAAALADRPNYAELFRRAFGTTEISARRVAFAIATYERTLISNQAPFDNFRLNIPGAMSQQQVRGFNAFQGSGCAACHNVNNDLFTDQTFANIGLRPNNEDLGRQNVTGNTADRGKFKVPNLRNVGLKRTFMHNGQFTTLQQVLGFYAGAAATQPPPDNRDPRMNGVNIPPPPPGAPPGTGPIPDMVEFLTNGLLDPRVQNQTFPFDRPTLFIDRPTDRAQIVPNTALQGSGGRAPLMIAQAPSMIGNIDYRLGVEVPGELVGAPATLAISTAGPVNGRIVPTETLGTVVIEGSTAGGTATVHWPIKAGSKADGQIVFAQWFVPDSGSPTGEARSAVAQIRFFCGSGGCPVPCVGDLDGDNVMTTDDLFGFLDLWFANNIAADINNSTFVDSDDLFFFLDAWFGGCSA